MSDKVTEKQKAIIKQYNDKYMALTLNTAALDKPKAEDVIRKICSYDNVPMPQKFFYVSSPYEGAVLSAKIAKRPDTLTITDADLQSTPVTKEEIKQQLSMSSLGQYEAYWVSFYRYCIDHENATHQPIVDLLDEMVHTLNVFWLFHGCAVLSERPTSIKIKDNKIHCEDDQAVTYPDGWGFYAKDSKPYKTLMEMRLAEQDEEEKQAN